MSADFLSFAVPLETSVAESLIPRLLATEEEYNGNVYLLAHELLIALLPQDVPLAGSPNFPVFVALDRFTTPPGQLLGGHAVRWLPPSELDELQAFLARLAADDRASLEHAASQLNRWGNGADDVEGGLAALAAGLGAARRTGRGLLLCCLPA